MKYAIAICLTILTSSVGFAQDTTYLEIREEPGALMQQPKSSRYDEIFGYQKTTRWLLKLNVLSALPEFSDDPVLENSGLGRTESFELLPRVGISGEVKLATGWSVDAGAQLGISSSRYFKGSRFASGWHVAPRWYFAMPRQVRSKQRSSNLSGNYVSIEYQQFTAEDRPPKSENFDAYRNTYQAVTLRFGMQRRLFKYGFVDLSLGVGKNIRQENIIGGATGDKIEHWMVEPRLAAGFAFGESKGKRGTTDWCDVLHCFEEKLHLFKVDLTQAIGSSEGGYELKPTVSYEQKIGHSAFSVEAELQGAIKQSDFQQFSGFSFNVQPRWYFLQKRQIARGKSGNNLSGLFGGVTVGTTMLWSDNIYFNDNPIQTFYTAPHVGAQLRLFDRGFLQYKFGIFTKHQKGRDFYLEPSGFYSELRAGFAF